MNGRAIRSVAKFFIVAYAAIVQIADLVIIAHLLMISGRGVYPCRMEAALEFLVPCVLFGGMCYMIWRLNLLKEGFVAFLFFYNCLAFAVNMVLSGFLWYAMQ